MSQLRSVFVRFVLFLVCCILSLFASSESFHYDFDVLDENHWELWDDNSVWKIEDGFLRAVIQPIDFNDAAFFQFKGVPGNYETFEFLIDDLLIQRQEINPGHDSFTITVNNLGSKSAGFGIAIGRRFLEVNNTYTFFYVFNTYGIEAKTYKWLKVGNWWNKEPRHPDVLQWDILELESMQIRFDKGHFQWFADDEKLAEFEDPEFSSIKIIGFLIQSNGIEVGSVWVDSFRITGPGLSVSPQTKLATTWATQAKSVVGQSSDTHIVRKCKPYVQHHPYLYLTVSAMYRYLNRYLPFPRGTWHDSRTGHR